MKLSNGRRPHGRPGSGQVEASGPDRRRSHGFGRVAPPGPSDMWWPRNSLIRVTPRGNRLCRARRLQPLVKGDAKSIRYQWLRPQLDARSEPGL